MCRCKDKGKFGCWLPVGAPTEEEEEDDDDACVQLLMKKQCGDSGTGVCL